MPTRLRRFSALFILSFCTLVSFHAASAGQSSRGDAAVRSTPAETLRSAQTIFIRTKSVYFKPTALEQALLDRSEVQQWGLVISRDKTDADLIIEVDRKLFTNRFVYSVLDPRSNRVLVSGKIGSLGGTVEGQIANGFVQRMRPFRSYGSPAQTR